MDRAQTEYDGVFNHQRLDAYRVALEFAGFAHEVVHRVPTGRSALREQLLHASESVVQNIAEGAAQVSAAMAKKHYRIALGSAAECSAVLDLLSSYGVGRLGAGRQLIGRAGAMLRRLAR
ncbi:MAG: four helix bundle protein [Deltaproteobacteria bacterium]|jgi:four helix bundle protein|nr:four helix bundle protein [Deltaproteobacteria bacterium]MBW2531363.1 four helix bundle protein [Deltaproteobacteria bacterium]